MRSRTFPCAQQRRGVSLLVFARGHTWLVVEDKTGLPRLTLKVFLARRLTRTYSLHADIGAGAEAARAAGQSSLCVGEGAPAFPAVCSSSALPHWCTVSCTVTASRKCIFSAIPVYTSRADVQNFANRGRLPHIKEQTSVFC